MGNAVLITKDLVIYLRTSMKREEEKELHVKCHNTANFPSLSLIILLQRVKIKLVYTWAWA